MGLALPSSILIYTFVKSGKILILGGGFGGVRTALDLERALGPSADITLIDRNSYHLFLPLLYEVASAFGVRRDPYSLKLRKTISIPYADIFQGKHIHFVQADITRVDLEHREVQTASGTAYSYDYLVIGLGSESADFGIPGVKAYAYQFKTIDDALMLNRRLAEVFEEASRGERTLPIRILVGGAGFTGVELAAELACCAKNFAAQCGLGRRCFTIALLEGGPKILPGISERERSLIVRRLTKLGVGVLEHTRIQDVLSDSIKLTDGRTMKGDIVLWTAGVEAHRFLRTIANLGLTDRGKIIVDEYLNVVNHENVFAVGDNIEFIDHRNQRPEPALAYVAVDHGKVAAKNIRRSIHGKERIPHKPFYDVWVAPVGGKYAVAHLWWNISIPGFLGWFIRQLVDFRYFLSVLPFKRALQLFTQEVEIFRHND